MSESLVSNNEARNGVISLQKKYTQSTKRRECPAVYLIFSFVKPPSQQSGPHLIRLPHPVRQFPFLKATVFVGGESTAWQKVFDQSGLQLTAVSMSNLQKHYSTRKERDTLLKSATYFFFDKPIGSQLPKRLGNQFFSRNRQPLQVELDINNPDQIAKEIQTSVECTHLYVKSSDSCIMNIGAFNMSFDHLAENICSAISQAMPLIPKAKARVSSICLMSSGITMPPLWEKNQVKTTLKAEDIKPKISIVEESEQEDEEE